MSAAFYVPAPLIFAALALDALAGDPPWLPHPVVLIGWAISWGEHRFRSGQPGTDFLNGLVLAVCVTTLAAAAAWVTIALCGVATHWLSYLAAVLVAWTTLALRGLDDAAKTVELSLRHGDENAARRAMPELVGRDPDRLDRAGMICATIESIAENLSDGIIAPLLFLFVGGPVAAMAYKATQKYLKFPRPRLTAGDKSAERSGRNAA
jgi:adenosylcobinamide-phosphate synthase